jgi:uncharacterized membrane protein
MGDSAAFCPKCGKSVGQPTVGGAAAAPSVATTTTTAGAGLQDNIAGLLAYLFIPAIIFLLVEPYNRNKFIRFHSFQSIFTGIFSIVVHTVLWAVPVIGWMIAPFFSLLMFIVWIVCMIKAFQMQYFKLPVIGDLAEKQANA